MMRIRFLSVRFLGSSLDLWRRRLNRYIWIPLIVVGLGWGAGEGYTQSTSSQTSSPSKSSASTTTQTSSSLKTPSPTGIPNPDRKIEPGDILSITIVGETGLETEFRVSSSGEIQFPFLDVVKVAGLTPLELKKKLETLLKKDYFVDPQVIVTVKQYRPTYVRVLGAVRNPGLVPLPGDQKFDILDVIASAGGTTRYAKSKVKYTHNGKTVTLSLDDLKRSKKKIWVQDGDIVEVEERIF